MDRFEPGKRYRFSKEKHESRATELRSSIGSWINNLYGREVTVNPEISASFGYIDEFAIGASFCEEIIEEPPAKLTNATFDVVAGSSIYIAAPNDDLQMSIEIPKPGRIHFDFTEKDEEEEHLFNKEKTILLRIQLVGCDDSTEFEYLVSAAEFELLKKISEKSKEVSEVSCMPTMHIWNISNSSL